MLPTKNGFCLLSRWAKPLDRTWPHTQHTGYKICIRKCCICWCYHIMCWIVLTMYRNREELLQRNPPQITSFEIQVKITPIISCMFQPINDRQVVQLHGGDDLPTPWEINAIGYGFLNQQKLWWVRMDWVYFPGLAAICCWCFTCNECIRNCHVKCRFLILVHPRSRQNDDDGALPKGGALSIPWGKDRFVIGLDRGRCLNYNGWNYERREKIWFCCHFGQS